MRALDSSRRPAASPPIVKRRRASEKTEVACAVSEHVARRLKHLRIQTGRTQTEMGTVLGMTFQQAAKYERGISKIAPGTLWRLAEFFGVGIEYFFAEFNSGSPEVTLPARQAEKRADQRRLRLELNRALGDIADTRMLRGLWALVQASSKRDAGTDDGQDGR
jgi:transcriptional regulator with XRE-family HTH domain